MSQQPPSGNLKWFRPQDGQTFSKSVHYICAFRKRFGNWWYRCGFFARDEYGTWNLHTQYGKHDLDEFHWLARLDDGRDDPQPVDAPGPLEVQSLRTHDDGQESPDPGFWYLATPYRSFSGNIIEAATEACKQAALLSDEGISVFSPIVHSHNIAYYTKLLSHASANWVDLDMPMVRAARGVIVCMLPGWEQSAGIHRECNEAIKLGKPVIHMTPDTIPEGLK